MASPRALWLSRPRPRPRLVLMLGSGGMRSVAVLGRVDVLARHGIRPVLVVSCSYGTLFDALIAAGTPSADRLAQVKRLWSHELTGQSNWRPYAQLLASRWDGFEPTSLFAAVR